MKRGGGIGFEGYIDTWGGYVGRRERYVGSRTEEEGREGESIEGGVRTAGRGETRGQSSIANTQRAAPPAPPARAHTLTSTTATISLPSPALLLPYSPNPPYSPLLPPTPTHITPPEAVSPPGSSPRAARHHRPCTRLAECSPRCTSPSPVEFFKTERNFRLELELELDLLQYIACTPVDKRE